MSAWLNTLFAIILTMTRTKQIPDDPVREPFRKMRNDREIGNISDLPKLQLKVVEKTCKSELCWLNGM